jgi:formamidopyrimidine-DNA glycosylase
MPELPEVETVRRGLAPVFAGATILRVDQRRPDLRFPFPENFSARLTGKRVESLERRAKYLLARLECGEVLVMHLGMSGSFRIEQEGEAVIPGVFHRPRSKLGLHDHVVFSLSNGGTVIYNDPRRFGFMQLCGPDVENHPLFRHLGVEPLGGGLTGGTLARLFAGKTTLLKAALLDQTLIAGLGNIYVCEALFRANLSPCRVAGTLVLRDGRPSARAGRLAEVIKQVLIEAVEAGGSSLRDHRQTDGNLGYFQHSFKVYGRAGDPCVNVKCTGTVERVVQNGRSTFHCGRCQR